MKQLDPLSREANPMPKAFWILLLVIVSIGFGFTMLNPSSFSSKITMGKLGILLFLNFTSAYGTITLIRDYRRGGFNQWIKRIKGKLDADEN